MKRRVPILAIAGFICLLLTDTRHTSYSSERGSAIHSTERLVTIAHGYGNRPMSFEPNQGQFDPKFQFGSQGANYALLLNPTGATVNLHDSTESKAAELTVRFRGTNKQASMQATDPLPGIANYYYGRREHWITRVPTYQRVVAENVYPGIDAVYYGNQGQFEYDFIVKPGASPKQIDVAFEGATKLAVAENGDLVISLGDREIRQAKPVIYQTIDGQRRSIEGRYVLTNGRRVGFSIGKYDLTQPLVIDPQVVYSTYAGGAFGYGAAMDSAGNSYICGAAEKSQGSRMAFAEKFSPADALIYSNYFGSQDWSSNETAYAIAVDAAGNAYVTGQAAHENPNSFPTINPIQPADLGGGAFITKFDPTGAMVYSTQLGGDVGTGIAVDALGNIHVTGSTSSTDFPTYKPYQANLHGSADAFVSVLNPQGSAYIFSTYIGGTDADFATSIAVDAAGNSYVSGTTSSTDFPVSGNLSPNHGNGDGFVLKLNAAGSALMYSIYVGGSGKDSANGIAVDSAGNAYVVGTTASADFPALRAFQSALSGSSDAFVAKINPAGTAFLYSTYLGGTKDEAGSGIAVNGTNAYVVGQTFSSDFPQVRSLQGFAGGSDAFVTKLSGDGASLLYSTFLGGSKGRYVPTGQAYAAARSIGTDGTNVVVTGDTNASDFPNTGVGECCDMTSFYNSESSFIAKFADDSQPATWTRVEQDNIAAQYSGDWATNTDPNHSGGSAKLTLVNSVTFSFSGTGARWIGFSDPWSGIANVYVDGIFQSSVDTYSSTSKYQVVQYAITGLSSGNHTLKIQATGRHNTAASSSWVWVDAFEWTSGSGIPANPDFGLAIGPASATVVQGGSTTYDVFISAVNGFSGNVLLTASGFGSGASGSFTPASITRSGPSKLTVTTTGTAQTGPFTLTITGSSGGISHSVTTTLNVNLSSSNMTWTRVEQDNAAVQYTGDWRTDANANYSGGSANATLTGSVTFSFSGTGVRWIGRSDPAAGEAYVYVDGEAKITRDTYSSASTYQVAQYTITGLAPGNHTIQIQGSGFHTSAASDSWVWVDAFEFTSSGNPDFRLTISPTADSVVQGSSRSYRVSVTPLNGFSGTVWLSAIVGSGASASFDPPSLFCTCLDQLGIASYGSSMLTVTTTNTAQTGTFTLTITGTSGGLQRSTTATLTVNALGANGVPDFGIAVTPASATVVQGDSATYTVTVTSINGFSGTVSLSDGLGCGWGPTTFSPPSVTGFGSSTMTVPTGATGGWGTCKLTITGSSRGLIHWTTAVLNANRSDGTGGKPDFSTAVTPATATVVQGSSTTFTATVTAANGFGGPVSLNASGFGSGASASFNPPSIIGSGSSTLTVTTTGTAQTGAFTLTITGTSGGLSHSSTATLNVNPAGGGTTWTRVEQDNPAVQYAGDWATNTDPNHSGGSAKLTLVNSVTFSFSGTGARWVGFSDPWSGIANVYVDGVFQTSVDTYSNTSKYQVVQYTTTGLPSGNHTLKIQATGQHGSAASSSWVWADAFEWTSSGGTGGNPDFSIAVTPTSATVVQGGSTTYTATVAGANGFGGTVSLSASGFGSGASGSFSPPTITGSGSSTLTVTTTGTAQTGAFTLTITGSSGGLSHSATVTLNVNSSGGGGGTTWTRVEQDNSAVQYTGDWATNTDPNHSGGSAKLTLVNSVVFGFSGTGARWIGFSDPWSGIANVYVDGVFQASVDTYSSTSKYQVVQYTTTGLASGNHTLKIQATGQHGSGASSSWVWVDAFESTSSGGTSGNPDFSIAVTPTTATVVQGGSTTYTATVTAVNGFGGTVSLSAGGFGSGASGSFSPASITGSGSSTLTVTTTSTAQTGAFPLTITGSSGGLSHSATVTLNVNASGGGTTWTRVEQTNAAVQYAGDWLTNTDPNHSGGSAALTMVNSVTFSFSGTGVRWIGFSDPWSGIANVYVDGMLQGSIDTYSSTSKYQVVQFTITGLASGNHTLKIQATGQHNSAASSSWVWVDAFEYAN